MFREYESFGSWRDKTVDVMQRRRFVKASAQLPLLGADHLSCLSLNAMRRKIESSWQDIESKPLRKQQEIAVARAVLQSIREHADCLSHDEHDLVERALILGGSIQIEDMSELAAARALSMRLWGNVGLVSGKPYFEIEPLVREPAAKAIAREEHHEIRRRFDMFHGYMTNMLYRIGVMDDRRPQQLILHHVLRAEKRDERAQQLARRYLWSGYDCMDYSAGVLLIHQALAEPQMLDAGGRRKTGIKMNSLSDGFTALDILPEEIPLQRNLECSLAGALRSGFQKQDVARTLRFLCKQGAPLRAMEEVLQEAIIICITDSMRCALRDMYYSMTKWMECTENDAVQ